MGADTGVHLLVADDAALALAQQRQDTAAELWQGRARWELVRAEDGDWAPHSPTGWLIHDTLSALVHPRQACAALVAALAVRGVEIVAEAPEAGQTLWATGVAGLETLNAGHPRLVGAGIKGQAALMQLDQGGEAQLFADGVHVIPHLDGTVAVGGTTEREYDSPDSTDAQLDAVIAKARAAVPALQDAPVIERWAGLRPRSRSRAPMLGAWPGRPEQYIANGGFKIGFGMAPKVAEVMADLLLEGRDAIPEGFRVADNL